MEKNCFWTLIQKVLPGNKPQNLLHLTLKMCDKALADIFVCHIGALTQQNNLKSTIFNIPHAKPKAQVKEIGPKTWSL